ncbi:hypothetical protein IB286_02870 [Spongiibacter sp. KMU-158]|uniref:DUF1311 domain-containing protein n=1 Tax=Spongiibacter pelagi TaxID=2760804 RepID=A0A927C1T7_9GAMM|nr:hypothetical protein [Spongiibacter pelagi]MBD2857935.1 hypothetical protein [Spongiibacter pelagi]
MKTQNRQFAVGILAFLMISGASALEQGSASECEKIERNMGQYEKLKAQGGTANEQSRWQSRQDHYAAMYSELSCQNSIAQVR